MRSHVEFRSRALLDVDVTNGGPHGEAVARFLAAQLPRLGYEIEIIVPEDWGWIVRLRHLAFPLWIGCGHYKEYSDGHLCFIEPSKPDIRRWFKRIPTSDVIERLASAIDHILRAHPEITGVRWWTDAEVNLGRR